MERGAQAIVEKYGSTVLWDVQNNGQYPVTEPTDANSNATSVAPTGGEAQTAAAAAAAAAPDSSAALVDTKAIARMINEKYLPTTTTTTKTKKQKTSIPTSTSTATTATDVPQSSS